MGTFTIEPVAGAVGAEVRGIDLATPLDDETAAELRAAFNDNGVLIFRDQALSIGEQLRFGRHFGPLGHHPYVEAHPDHPEVLEVITEPDDRVNFGGGWHSDVTFLPEPDLGSILYAVDVPAYGGDTLFADQRAAYDALSDTMKGLLDGLVAVHSAGLQYSGRGYSKQSSAMVTHGEDEAAASEVEHPVIRTHPETGRKSLFVNRAFTARIKGMHRAESAALLEFLFGHGVKERFTCRLRWQPGSVAMWDNRSVQHYALHDYKGSRRHMRRITIQGDRPR
ncbi:MAG: TauD/TfdA family dioxygenase [Actinomycetota bacterium]